MPDHFFEEVIDFKELQKEARTLFLFAALRLHEPKNREGVLGPDLRVLVLLSKLVPWVSPEAFLGNLKSNGEEVGAGRASIRLLSAAPNLKLPVT
jgi:hypothetical protein